MMSAQQKPLASLGVVVTLLVATFCACARGESTPQAASSRLPNLWSHDNLFAWCVVPFDAEHRTPEERAQMLQSLGFKSFAYDWREKDIPTFDAEIDALQAHGISVLAWWFPFDADSPMAKSTLELFRRHDIHPQLWVLQSLAGLPQTRKEWAKVLPRKLPLPQTDAGWTDEEWKKLSNKDRTQIQKVAARVDMNNHFPKSPQEQARRVQREADRIEALVRLAAPYGTEVYLYNHNGWFGREENQLAIIDGLEHRGITNVGMVYNFSHARDETHDDSQLFPELWNRIKAHVVAVNVTGMHRDGVEVYPSQGDSDLAMMRTIERSGWRGPVGIIAEKGGDARVTLQSDLVGLDWLAAELRQPGSGGPRPFPPVK